jgi:hypothetical protein
MKKSRAERRSQRQRVICRKVHILKRYGGDNYVYAWSAGGKKIGRFAKGKIHCSCPMCRRKSYDDPSTADKRKLISAQQQIDEV